MKEHDLRGASVGRVDLLGHPSLAAAETIERPGAGGLGGQACVAEAPEHPVGVEHRLLDPRRSAARPET
jgi:hypothetical protein